MLQFLEFFLMTSQRENNMMPLHEDMQQWESVVIASFQNLFEMVGAYLPNLLGALLLLLIGWLTAKTLKKVTVKVTRICGIHALGEKAQFNELLKKVGISKTLDEILGGLVYYLTFLVFLVSASEVLGVKVVLETLNAFIVYLPHILGAFLILVLSLYVARVVKDTVRSASSSFNIAYANAASSLLEIVIIGFGVVMALTEIGVDMTVLTTNVTLLLAGVVFAMALSVGLGSRTVISNALARYYVCQIYHVGDEVHLAGHKGTIIEMTPVSVVLKTDNDENLHIPNEQIIKEGSNVRKS